MPGWLFVPLLVIASLAGLVAVVGFFLLLMKLLSRPAEFIARYFHWVPAPIFLILGFVGVAGGYYYAVTGQILQTRNWGVMFFIFSAAFFLVGLVKKLAPLLSNKKYATPLIVLYFLLMAGFGITFVLLLFSLSPNG